MFGLSIASSFRAVALGCFLFSIASVFAPVILGTAAGVPAWSGIVGPTVVGGVLLVAAGAVEYWRANKQPEANELNSSGGRSNLESNQHAVVQDTGVLENLTPEPPSRPLHSHERRRSPDGTNVR